MEGVGSGGMSDCLCLTRGMEGDRAAITVRLCPREGEGTIFSP
jgi:hypothetical protein